MTWRLGAIECERRWVKKILLRLEKLSGEGDVGRVRGEKLAGGVEAAWDIETHRTDGGGWLTALGES